MRCAVFKAMFNDQAQKGEGAQNANVPFVLTDIQPDIFLAMLEFIYTNCVTLTPKIVSYHRSVSVLVINQNKGLFLSFYVYLF